MRRVGKTCHILVAGNYYSVPCRYVGETVRVRLSRRTVKIYDARQASRYGEGEAAAAPVTPDTVPDGAAVPGDALLAVHTRLWDRGAYQTNRSHYPEGKRQTEAEAAAAAGDKTKQIGAHAHTFFLQYRQRRSADWRRGIAALTRLSGHYGAEAVDLACKRASEFEVYSCRTVANICRKGLWRDAGCPLAAAAPDSAAVPAPVSVSAAGQQYVRSTAAAVSAPPCGEIGRPLSYYAQLIAA